jgi:hypothetical protein
MSRQYKEFENRVIFYGNTPLEWKELKPKIINEFKGENCWDLVSPELGWKRIERGDGEVEVSLEEYVFNDAQPIEKDFIKKKLEEFDNNIKVCCEKSLDIIQKARGKTVEWKAEETYKVEQNKIVMEAKRPASIDSYEKSFRDVHTMWSRNQTEYYAKVASVIKVFNRCLGKAPKAVVSLPFNAQRFREAWTVLDEYYFNKLSEAEIDIAIDLKLMELRYNERIGLEGFLNQLNSLYAQSKNDQNDLTKKQTYLMYCLKESSHPFKDVLSNINVFASLDFNGIVEALRRRDVEIKGEKRRKQNPNSYSNDYAFHTDNYSPTNAPNQKKQRTDKGSRAQAYVSSTSDVDTKSVPWCTECEREGHTVKNCFTLVPCPICGNTGHGAKWCKEKKKSSTRNASGIGAGNGRVSDPPKTKAMFQKNNPRKGKA